MNDDVLKAANDAFVARYPGEGSKRQPCQTAYVGAHEVTADTVIEWQAAALRALDEHAADASVLADVLAIDRALADAVRRRVVSKLEREPIEDLRVDFEDGYGNRPDAEEDAHVVAFARAAAAMKSRPPYFGARVKPLNEDLRARSVKTTDGVVTAISDAFGAQLPSGFVFTLAKVTVPEQVTAFAVRLGALERALRLPDGALTFEIMIEVAQAVIGPRGECVVPRLVEAGDGRCVAAHLGTYDYTASLGITAAHQSMAHPACDFARRMMQVSLAGRGVWLSDGSTMILPVGGRDHVHAAWKRHATDVRRSLVEGFYQGWDMHPAQLVTRYGAAYAFFLEALPKATERLRAFVERASRAAGGAANAGVIDDAATGQALLNFLLRGMACGAITEDEALRTGLTLEEIRGRSFAKVLAARRA